MTTNPPLKPSSVLSRSGLDGFVLALLGMILLAYLWPDGGIDHEHFSLATVANYGVSFIFFFYGLKLSKEKLQAGLSNWRLHVLVQGTTFILFPLLLLPFRCLLSGDHLHLLWLGCFFLASLPSTVSSSVVMVSIAKGNVPAAIFNASISSLLGVFITPLWMGLVLAGSSDSLPVGDVMTKLLIQVLLPVTMGVLLNRFWGVYAERFKKQLKYFDQIIILAIVYASFCESFKKKMFADFAAFELVVLGAVMLALFFIVYGITTFAVRRFKFSTEDEITATFCASKKSLVHGTVMSRVLFANSAGSGILLLPLMMYHALQLIVVSLLATRWSRRKDKEMSTNTNGQPV